MWRTFLGVFAVTILTAGSCKPETSSDQEETDTAMEAVRSFSTLEEVLPGRWLVASMDIADFPQKNDLKREYYYEFREDGTFEAGTVGQQPMGGRYIIEGDTVWLNAEEIGMGTEAMPVVRFNKDTIVSRGMHDKLQMAVEMILVNEYRFSK